LSTLKLARPMRTASVIWVATSGIVAELAMAYAFVHLKILGVFAMQVLRRAHATRTPTAIVARELNAFVSVLVIVRLLPSACVIQALRAHVTLVQRARVVSVRPVPVQDCAIVVRDPVVNATQVPIAAVAKVQPVPVQDCVVVVRDPSATVAKGRPVPVQDCVVAVRVPIAIVAKVRPVPVQDCVVVVRDPSVCVVLARHVRVQDCVPVTLARSVHAIQARHVLVSQVRRAPAA
jgi:hypothetical protein